MHDGDFRPGGTRLIAIHMVYGRKLDELILPALRVCHGHRLGHHHNHDHHPDHHHHHHQLVYHHYHHSLAAVEHGAAPGQRHHHAGKRAVNHQRRVVRKSHVVCL